MRAFVQFTAVAERAGVDGVPEQAMPLSTSNGRKRAVFHAPIGKPPTLNLTLRRDGRWAKKIGGKTVYLGAPGTTEDEARAKLIELLKKPDEQMILFPS